MNRCVDLTRVRQQTVAARAENEDLQGSCFITHHITYGSEAWRLTDKTQAKINGANARCVQHITGKTEREEASVVGLTRLGPGTSKGYE